MNLQQAKNIPITWFFDRVLGLHGTQQTIFYISRRLERIQAFVLGFNSQKHFIRFC